MDLKFNEEEKKVARQSYKRPLKVKYCSICGCGSYWLIKGKCRQCYQREYMRTYKKKNKKEKVKEGVD